MIWLKLKLHLIPSISQEVDTVCRNYDQLLIEAGKKDKLKELLLLQASIRGRIQEFDELYEKHYDDPLIPHFEKQKLRLRKLLQKEPPKAAPPQETIKPQSSAKPVTTDDFIKDILQKPARRTPTPPPVTQSEWKELVFKIKLTKQEYSRLLTMKTKRSRIL